jgi:outer membrane protein OmpA-like peptidoglycan-associated protein
MKFAPLHASLMTLALFAIAAPAQAGSADREAAFRLAQAETEADFEQIRKFLAGGRDLSRLDDERLQQRLNRAKRFQRADGLPAELAQELEQEVAQINAEIERRQQAAAEPPAAAPEEPQTQAEQPPVPEPQPEPEQQAAPEPEPPQPEPEQQAAPEPEPPQPEPQQQAAPETPQPQPQPEVTQQAQQDAAPEAAPEAAQSGGSDEVALFLRSVRPASELSEDELRRQMRQATELARTKGLPREQRQALRDVIREARTALRSKGGEDAAGADTPSAPEQQAEPQPQPQPQPPVAEQPQPQPQQQAQPPAAEQPQPQPQQQQAQPTQVDPALERQARAILDDQTDVSRMNRRELRQRLSGMRDLLASEKLSPETREALREKLATERQILRREVTSNERGERPSQGADTGTGTGTGTGTVNNNVVINNNNTVVTNVELRQVLRDRRPPEELDEDELVRRIDIYREIARDERYEEAERRAWRRALERDRRYLRRQMLEERQARAERLRSGQFQFEIEIGGEYDPDDEMMDDVFAAEVDEEELAKVLAAPPRRRIERRYSIEEFERVPEAREAVARIEIDTVNFGFGEGFLREEEIDKLDRIAQVLERILAKNPDEVFLLEGHTDAVGSDASNLALSRQRAQAVKEALTTYYVIPAENLKTVGLGERYLKIPTQQAEAENRRVSLARVTQLVGELD